MSDAVEQRLVDLLDSPQLSPYGMPIPGLSGLSAETPEQAQEELAHLSVAAMGRNPRLLDAVAEGASGPFVLMGIPEVVQTRPELLSELSSHGLLTGTRFTARTADDGSVLVRALPDDDAPAGAEQPEADGGEAHLPVSAAAAIFVRRA